MSIDSGLGGSQAGGADAWDLGRVVSELRAPRQESPAHELPSREAVAEIVDGLRAALFPAHFGSSDLTDEGLDYFVGHKLDVSLRSLHEQARRTLRASGTGGAPIDRRADEITRAFAARLPAVRALLDGDVRAAFAGDPAAKTLEEALFCYPGVTAIIHHRIAHELHVLGMTLLARIISDISHEATGVHIHPGARIGAGFFIAHGTGVVIGETAVIGERVRLHQGVTLGAASGPRGDDGARHPIVEDDVVIYAGATILGRVTIGRGSSIGGNVWLTRDVPPGSRVTQALATSEVFGDGGGI